MWQGSLGVAQPAMALPTSQPQVTPAGQVVGSSGQPFLPPMSQLRQPGQGTGIVTNSAVYFEVIFFGCHVNDGTEIKLQTN